jgi:hypothetical protein
VGFISVYLNGVLLGSADYTATNGTTVVLATGAAVGNLVTVESFQVSSVLNAIPNTAGAVSSSNIQTSVALTTPTMTSPTISSGPLTIGTTALGAGNASIMKNRIINGAMVIDQRNAGASISNPSGYTLDRWNFSVSQASKFTAQQNQGSATPPTGFSNYLGLTSSSAYSIVAGDYFQLYQQKEGFNTSDLMFGTANAKTVTLSFQVYSSLTGTFGGALRNGAGDRSYPFTYSIPVANTWTSISITIAGDTTGTWVGATNGVGLTIFFGLGVGSTLSGTAGAWASANYNSATGATSVVGTNGATFYITGVQLEVGSSATGFEYVNYQTSLANCQRYFQVGSRDQECYVSAVITTTLARTTIQTYQEMRATPTITVASGGTGVGQMTFLTTAGNFPATIGSHTASGITANGFYITGSGYTAAGWAAGACTLLFASNGVAKIWQASAEL